MKNTIVLGIAMGVLGLGVPAFAQTPKTPEAVAAQMQASPEPAPNELVKLLESKGILTGAEAAILSETALQPQAKQVLAEMLLSKHLITEVEYDRTIEACSGTAARATLAAAPDSSKVGRTPAARSMLLRNGELEGPRMSFSDWIASILPGGTESTTDMAFGTIQPEQPALYYPEQDELWHVRPKAQHKSKKQHRQDSSPTTPGSPEPKQ